jgi:uncharacterized membrane protein
MSTRKILFKVSMWWRIIYGLLRVVLGATLLRLIGQPFAELTYALMAHEITNHTTDIVLEHLYTFLEIHNFTITYFIAIYFLFWGTVDIILSLCLLRKIEQAFPITMALIVIFICYGIFRYTHTHSLVLLTVIIIDIGIVYLINHEYKKLLLQKTPPQLISE